MLAGSLLSCLAYLTARAVESARPEAIKNWEAKRFGMFIHWGPISLKGTEIGISRIPGPNGEPGGTCAGGRIRRLGTGSSIRQTSMRTIWVSVAQAAGAKIPDLYDKASRPAL